MTILTKWRHCFSHFTGITGDVDTSDANRQSSVDDDTDAVSSRGAKAGKQQQQSQGGFGRTLNSLFSSLSKSGARKAAEKRKTLQLDSPSSTDTERTQDTQETQGPEDAEQLQVRLVKVFNG